MRNNNYKHKNKVVEPRVNDEIRGYDTVRVIYKEFTDRGSENDISGVFPLYKARRIAESKGLDLIEINTSANPPVVKIANYSKYLYELKKSLKQKQKPQNTVKEVQLSANISSHDLQIKANKAKSFIEDGDKVKVVLTLRGREMVRKEDNKKSLYEFIDVLSDVAVPESMPREEGNKSVVILKRKNK